jgi:hypothetical protein
MSGIIFLLRTKRRPKIEMRQSQDRAQIAQIRARIVEFSKEIAGH